MRKKLFLTAICAISTFIFGCDQGSDNSGDGGHKNKAPIFITTAPTVAEVGELYRYDLTVINPDGKAKTSQNTTVSIGAEIAAPE